MPTLLYQNKEWLKNKYINEKFPIYQIAKLCRISHRTIHRWMIKYDIPRRSASEAVHLGNANHCTLFKEAIEWINGELLGDGSLRSRSLYSASFGYGSKYIEYIKYISDTLKSFGIKQSGKIIKRIDKKLNNITYHYESCDYVELLHIRKKWYQNGKKIVPKDIKITPLTLRQHYIGDGSLRCQKGKRPRIFLYTYGFSIFNVRLLIKRLIILGFKVTRHPSSNIISFSSSSTKDFLNYIGKCPVKCYQYKWEY